MYSEYRRQVQKLVAPLEIFRSPKGAMAPRLRTTGLDSRFFASLPFVCRDLCCMDCHLIRTADDIGELFLFSRVNTMLKTYPLNYFASSRFYEEEKSHIKRFFFRHNYLSLSQEICR